MKKIQLYRMALLAMLPALVLTSCRFTDDDYFDESPALRIEHQGDAVRELLTSAPNGWVMQFFCASEEATFEGFNLFARFEANDKVTFASNHRFLRNGNAGKYTEASSIYEILNEDGLVLAFNVWNDVLTPFSDPVSFGYAPDYIVKNGIGMMGDHNFVVMSYNDNEIIMRGERHQAEVRLVKCDRSWQDYISSCNETKDRIGKTFSNFYVLGEKDTLYFSGLRSGKFLYCNDLDYTRNIKVDSLACCFTPNGFRLEKKNTIGSNVFQEFAWNSDNILVSEDGKVKVVGVWDDFIISHTGLWAMDSTLFSSEQKSILNQVNEEIKNFNSAWSLKDVSMGKSLGNNAVLGLVFSFYTDAAKTDSKKRTVGLALNMTKYAYGKMKIVCDDVCKVDNNMSSISKKATNLEALTRQFGSTLTGVYNIVPNDYYSPTGADFAPIEGGIHFSLQ